jgi:predicted AlkP superfamily phosphohydrolase/phosphomutase
MATPKLTVIGLDAATFDVLDPLLEAGQLPNLADVLESGSNGVLRSTTHPVTTQAWTTMLTGVNAGRHGMWEFCERDPTGYRLRLVNGSHRRAPAVWDHLAAADRRVGVVNVPFTWPAQRVDGFFVAGIDAAARERGMTYPESVLDDLRRRYGHLELDHELPLDSEGYIDVGRMRTAIEQKVDSCVWLADRFEPELLIVVFMAADHIQHYGWQEWEEDGSESRVADVYRMLDQAVGTLREAFGRDHDVLVVSDHGAGRVKGVVNINAWLAEHGWLIYRDSRRMGRELPRYALYRALELRHKLPKRLRHFAKQKVPRFRDRIHELKEFVAIDFAKTRAFAYGNFGNVVINVRGREKYGTVAPGEEYDQLCREISERALELTDPETGDRIVATVHRRDELFHGPELEKIPDLIFEFAGYEWVGKGNLMRRTPTIWEDTVEMVGSGKEKYVGTHRQEGIFALCGGSAVRRSGLSANIEDIAPTLLYLLGEPIPFDVEGRVLEEAIQPALLDARPPEYAEGRAGGMGAIRPYTPDEVGEVEGRLRDLGYLE